VSGEVVSKQENAPRVGSHTIEFKRLALQEFEMERKKKERKKQSINQLIDPQTRRNRGYQLFAIIELNR